MRIVCNECQAKFNVPDEKLPADKTVKISCPKCKNKIQIKPKSEPKIDNFENDDSDIFSDSQIYDAWEKPFDFIDSNKDTALICDENKANISLIEKVLTENKYQITIAKSADNALKSMQFHVYNLIIINENYKTDNPDNNTILSYLEKLNMAIRRNIFVVLVSDRYRTLDNMAAFQKSVNIIINTKQIKDINNILKQGINDNDNFYRVFKDTLIKIGKN